MPVSRKEKKTRLEKASDGNADALWRQPIMLDSFGDEDPLERLYRGREAGGIEQAAVASPPKSENSQQKAVY